MPRVRWLSRLILRLTPQTLKVRFHIGNNQTLAGIKVVLPAAMGFSFASQSASCSESNPNLAASAFINRSPACNLFYDTTPATYGNVWIQITNLATSTQPFYYGVRISGLKNGPSAITMVPGTAFCTSYVNNLWTAAASRDQPYI